MLLLRSESVPEPPELEELLLLLLPDLLLLDLALGLSDFFESFLLEDEDEVVEPDEELFAFVPDDLELDPEALLLELPLGEDKPLPEEEDPPVEDPPKDALPLDAPPDEEPPDEELPRELLLVLFDDEVGLELDELLPVFELSLEF